MFFFPKGAKRESTKNVVREKDGLEEAASLGWREGNRGKRAINLHELEEGERMFWENYYGWSK